MNDPHEHDGQILDSPQVQWHTEVSKTHCTNVYEQFTGDCIGPITNESVVVNVNLLAGAEKWWKNVVERWPEFAAELMAYGTAYIDIGLWWQASNLDGFVSEYGGEDALLPISIPRLGPWREA